MMNYPQLILLIHKQLYVLMNVYHYHLIFYVDDMFVVDFVFLYLDMVFDEVKIPVKKVLKFRLKKFFFFENPTDYCLII
jgi:hypothetical protein